MYWRITRRDFLDGVRIAAGGLALGAVAQSQPAPPNYPPALGGMRGSNPGSFEIAHAARDGQTWDDATPLSESYDLIVVGSGISGLPPPVSIADRQDLTQRS